MLRDHLHRDDRRVGAVPHERGMAGCAVVPERLDELRDLLTSHRNDGIEIFQGSGAFVCGEETALMASIEGKRGNPVLRPPYPTERGLWGKPSMINNVETYANVAPIMEKGADWFAADYYKLSPVGTPTGPATGGERVYRGGG